MHTVLAVLGWTLLALLGILALLLLVPVRLTVEVKYDKLTVKGKVLFLSFQLYPWKWKKRREAAEDTPQPQETEKQAQPQGQPPQEATEAPPQGKQAAASKITLSAVAEMVRTAGWLMKIVFRVLRFTDIRLLLPIHREDAAETAIAYGQTQAYLGTALGALQNFLNLKFSKLELVPDFTGSHKYRRYFYCKIVATPFIMVAAALYAFTHLKVERIL